MGTGLNKSEQLGVARAAHAWQLQLLGPIGPHLPEPLGLVAPTKQPEVLGRICDRGLKMEMILLLQNLGRGFAPVIETDIVNRVRLAHCRSTGEKLCFVGGETLVNDISSFCLRHARLLSC